MEAPTPSEPSSQPQAPKEKKIEKQKGKVKSVLSGDTVILVVPPNNSEKELTLSSLTAPRTSRGNGAPGSGSVKEEPFSWESRQFLCDKVLGQSVLYTVENKNEKTKREYGNLFLNNGEEDVALQVSAAGWAKVFMPKGEPRGHLAELATASKEAAEKGLGLFGTATERTTVLDFDAFQLLEKWKGKEQKGFVEQIRTGSSFKILVEDTAKGKVVLYPVVVKVAGVQAPQGFTDGKPDPTQPFFSEAKLYSEFRLLNRRVTLRFKEVERNQSFVARVLLDQRNIAEALLAEGLAAVVHNYFPEDATTLRSLEQKAKAERKKLWSQSEVAAEGGAGAEGEGGREFTAKVREVHGGGAVTVVEGRLEQKVYLSSLNVPRLGGPGRPDEPFAWEAKEALRSLLVGKKVQVFHDYTKVLPPLEKAPEKPQDKAPEKNKGKDKDKGERRLYCSLIVDGKDVGVELARKGLARVLQHRATEPRARHYDQLLLAENKAAQREEGVHVFAAPKGQQAKGQAPKAQPAKGQPAKPLPQDQLTKLLKDVPTHHYTDLTLRDANNRPDLKKAKQFLHFMEGQRQTGVVEYVVTALRYKVYVPKQCCMFWLLLTSLRLPDKSGPAAVFAEEATDFARDTVLQRDVELDIEGQDKGGNFLGTLYLNKKNYALQLVEQGFVSVVPSSSPHQSSYADLEKKAKQAKKKIWSVLDEAPKEVEVHDVVQEKPKSVKLLVTEVVDGSTFYYTLPGDEQNKFRGLMAQLQSPSGESYTPALKERCLCLFSDNSWHRVQIVGKNKTNSLFRVFYIDFGNEEEEVEPKRLRKLEGEAAQVAAQAKKGHLAFLRVPSLEEDFGPEAASFFRDLAYDKVLVASIEYKVGDQVYMSLGDPTSQVHVNLALVSYGLARLRLPPGSSSPLIAKLREEEEKAKTGRFALWQYGDLFDDDEEEFPRRRR